MQTKGHGAEQLATPSGGAGAVDAIRRRFLLFGVLGVVLSGLLGGLVGMVPLANHLEQMAADNLRQTLRDRERIIAVQLAQITEVARQVASRTKARQVLSAAMGGEMERATGAAIVAPILRDALQSGQALRGITRLDSEGAVFVSVGRALPAEYHQAWATPGPRLIGPITIDGAAHIVVAAAIVNRAGRLVGTDLVLFDASVIVNTDGRPWRVGNQGRVFVVAKDEQAWQFFATAAYSEHERALLALAARHAGEFSAGDLVEDTLPNRQTYFAATQRIDSTDWRLLGFASEQELRAPMRAQLSLFVAMLLGLTVLAACAIWALMRPLAGRLLLRAEDLDRQIADKTRALEHKNAELEQFAYTASHDLKGPLRNVRGLASFLQMDAGDSLGDNSVQALEHMNNSLERMERLIEDLLAYARAGRQDQTVELVDTAELVHGLAVLLAPSADFVIRCEPPMPVLRTTKTCLELVLRNLIANAIKHHDRAQAEVVVSAEPNGERWQFSVCDDGPGIAAEAQERIFGMFQTASSDANNPGSGMGLALCKKLVEQFGGTIWVQSELGQGACFYFDWVPERA